MLSAREAVLLTGELAHSRQTRDMCSSEFDDPVFLIRVRLRSYHLHHHTVEDICRCTVGAILAWSANNREHTDIREK